MRILCALLIALMSGAPRAEGAEPRDEARARQLLDTYRGMLDSDPADDYAFRRLLETAHAAGGLSGVIALYRDEVARAPKRYASWLVLGHLLATAEDVAGALECYAKATALEPKAAHPHLFTAAIHRRKKAFEEAFSAYDRGVALLRDREAKQAALREAAETAVEAKDIPRARQYFEKLIQTEPNNRFLRMQEASTLSRLGESVLALEAWRDIEGRTSDLGELLVIWKEIAALELELDRYPEAEAAWRKGIERLPLGHYERRVFLEGLVSVRRRSDDLRALIPELSGLAERDFDALVTLARLHEELAEDEVALTRYREAERRKPTDEAIRMTVLTLLERMGRTEEVFEAWEKLLETFPREPRYALKLAELYFQRTRTKEAQELMRRTSRAHPSDPGVHHALVELWLRFGDKAMRAEVEGEYKILMKLEPEESTHVVSLGEYYWSIDEKARALETWGKLRKMGARGEGLFAFGEVLADHDQLEPAREAYEAALELAPMEARYLRALALLQERAGRGLDALALWQKIIDLPNRPQASVNREAREHLFDLWEKLRRTKSELARLEDRFRAEPPDIGAGRLLAVVLQKMGRTEEAVTVLERLSRLVPDDLETLLGLEQAYARRGAVPEAIGVLENLARLMPRAATEYLYRAADLALGAADDGLASRLLRRILELSPGEAQAYLRVGELYLRMGLRADAAEAWRQAQLLDPRNMAVRFRLASVYRELGDGVREAQSLEAIVRETSDPADVTRAGRRLVELALASGSIETLEEVARTLGEGREGAHRAIRARLVIEVYVRVVRMLRAGPSEGRDKRLLELGERALKPLVMALEESDLTMRAEALEVIEATRPAGAVPALSRLALEPEAVGHVAAIAALGRIGTAGAAGVLWKLLGVTTATTRELALWALGLGASNEGLKALTDRATHGTPRERMLAALALGKGRHVGGEALALRLAEDKQDEVREVGLWALGRLKVRGGLVELDRRLSEARSAREVRVVVWSLAQIGTEAAQSVLLRHLFQGRDFDALVWEGWWAAKEVDEAEIDAGYVALLVRERGAIASFRPGFYLPSWDVTPLLSDLAVEGPVGGLVAATIAETLRRNRPEELLALGRSLLWKAGTEELSFFPLKTQDHALVEAMAGLVRAHLEPHHASVLSLVRDVRMRPVWLRVWRGLRLPEAPREVREAALDEIASPTSDASLRTAIDIVAEAPALEGEETDRVRAGRLVTHPSVSVRRALGALLVTYRDEASLLVLLEDEDMLVVEASCRALVKHPFRLSPRGLERLVERSVDPRPFVAEAARAALEALRGTN